MTTLRWVVAVAGLLLLGAGVVGAIQEWPVQGLVFVFLFGLACMLLALIADRIQGLDVSHGETKVGVQLAPLQAVQELEQSGLEGAAATYAFIHNQLTDRDESRSVKVLLQDRLVELVRQTSFTSRIDQDRVRRAVEQGTPAERVLAFGVLEGQPAMTTVGLLEQGIGESQSGNEQYHALLAAEKAWPRLTEAERERVCTAIRTGRTSPFIADDSDRKEVADRLLARAPVAR